MESFLDRVVKALSDEESREALKIGRGQVSREAREERIGVVKGLGRAIQIVKDTARPEEKDD